MSPIKHISTLIIAACTIALPGFSAVADHSDALAKYIDAHPGLSRQGTLEVHYTDHHRRAFEVASDACGLRFNLHGNTIGLAELRPSGQAQGLVKPGSLSLTVTTPDGKVYKTHQARKPARINIFRHGPRYFDIHVYDLTPTDPQGNALPLKGELVFHVWPRRLYVECRLHPEQAVPIKSATVDLQLEPRRITGVYAGHGNEHNDAASLPSVTIKPGGWCNFTGRTQSLGYLLTSPEGTSEAEYLREGARLTHRFAIEPGTTLEPGDRPSIGFRLHVSRSTSFQDTMQQAAIESHPLTADRFTVGDGARFEGYNPRTGYYTVSTACDKGLWWLYNNPEYNQAAPITIRNDGRARTVAIRHANSKNGGRLGAGVVTDPDGRALPILVQNSKNFSGEKEEAFYDPGDPMYNETYFVLPVEPDAELALNSCHTYQGWGNHLVKQVCSLQAWMHYYQMSLGVTETTCHVPFRFGGHGGIWVADLRGISGEQWASQPQFDNVAGHRVFHYRDGERDRYPRYLRSGFRSTGPNLADFWMDYVTETGAARLRFDLFEPPQPDQTRSFVKMRVEFDKPVTIENARQDLKLFSLDTTQQRLRYERFGYTDAQGKWKAHTIGDDMELPITTPLTARAPAVAFYGLRADSHQHGNNAIVVQRWRATAGGKQIKRLVAGLDRKANGELMAWLTFDAERLVFKPGDRIELDLIIMPYGHVGGGHEPVVRERQRYGLNHPAVRAAKGVVVEQFPARVRVARDGGAAFTMTGGFGVMPLMIEGFDTYTPPTLERLVDGRWRAVTMTTTGHEGHQSYRTKTGAYGFVFVIETDGQPARFRVE